MINNRRYEALRRVESGVSASLVFESNCDFTCDPGIWSPIGTVSYGIHSSCSPQNSAKGASSFCAHVEMCDSRSSYFFG